MRPARYMALRPWRALGRGGSGRLAFVHGWSGYGAPRCSTSTRLRHRHRAASTSSAWTLASARKRQRQTQRPNQQSARQKQYAVADHGIMLNAKDIASTAWVPARDAFRYDDVRFDMKF